MRSASAGDRRQRRSTFCISSDSPTGVSGTAGLGVGVDDDGAVAADALTAGCASAAWGPFFAADACCSAANKPCPATDGWIAARTARIRTKDVMNEGCGHPRPAAGDLHSMINYVDVYVDTPRDQGAAAVGSDTLWGGTQDS